MKSKPEPKPAPLHVLLSRLNGRTLEGQISRLILMVAQEKPLSVRRDELERLLESKRRKQLEREVA